MNLPPDSILSVENALRHISKTLRASDNAYLAVSNKKFTFESCKLLNKK